MAQLRSVAATVFGRLKPLLAMAVVGLAIGLLYRTLSAHSFEDVAAQLRSVDGARIAAALAFAAGSYGCLTVFDVLALHFAEKPLSYPKAALASFVSLSLGHNLGFAALSSGAIRYRFYSRWGLGAGDVAKVILFCGLTVAIGLATLAALALAARPDLAMRATGLSRGLVLWLAVASTLALGAYLVSCIVLRKELQFAGWSVRLPSWQLAIGQFIVGPLNFAMVAACLHQSIAATGPAAFLDVAAAYVLANIASLVTHVPGGLGVIEALVSLVLAGSQVIGGLIIFRLVYFWVPLLFGGVLLAVSELLLGRSPRATSSS
ncbi:lysylphosphatidylglycerol synthase domain-containing protein [Bosea sp. RCC_152_1]|uniref:lysylphosphatidylglycerol synthase domain-containing protein n=1 Tax=Bosea sp. RCC_152_1 TaxID=3239228 RepID=UPI0035250E36